MGRGDEVVADRIAAANGDKGGVWRGATLDAGIGDDAATPLTASLPVCCVGTYLRYVGVVKPKCALRYGVLFWKAALQDPASSMGSRRSPFHIRSSCTCTVRIPLYVVTTEGFVDRKEPDRCLILSRVVLLVSAGRSDLKISRMQAYAR